MADADVVIIGANAERILFFLGRKRREDLPSKVDPERLIAARATIDAKITDWIEVAQGASRR